MPLISDKLKGSDCMTELLQEIINTPSPCGSEEKLRMLIEKIAVPIGDKLYTDNLGSLVVRKSGNGKRLMLCANMDQPALIVNFIDDKGKLFFGQAGSIKGGFLSGRSVVFLNGVTGVIVSKNDSTDGIKSDDFLDMYIDLGCNDKKSAEKLVRVGDAAVLLPIVTELSENKLCCGGLDNKIGVYVLLEVLQRMISSAYDTYFVFTVQRNMGNKGVKAAAFNVEPEIGIAVSAVYGPEVSGGVAIKVKDKSVLCQSAFVDKLSDIAGKKQLPYQYEVSKETSEAGEIYKTGNGVVTGGIGIPAALSGTGNEQISLSDTEHAINLLLAFLAG